MNDRNTIEVLARAVCIRRGRLLLCRNVRRGYTYLPGGHVEFGERAAAALKRELREEMGVRAETGRFLGAFENVFRQKGRKVGEVSLVFEVRIRGLTVGAAIPSREKKLAFEWVALRRLAGAHCRPRQMPRLLATWLRHPAGASRWASL